MPIRGRDPIPMDDLIKENIAEKYDVDNSHVYIKFSSGNRVVRVLGNYMEGLNYGTTVDPELVPSVSEDGYLEFRPRRKLPQHCEEDKEEDASNVRYIACGTIKAYVGYAAEDSIFHVPRLTKDKSESAPILGITMGKIKSSSPFPSLPFPMVDDYCEECEEEYGTDAERYIYMYEGRYNPLPPLPPLPIKRQKIC